MTSIAIRPSAASSATASYLIDSYQKESEERFNKIMELEAKIRQLEAKVTILHHNVENFCQSFEGFFGSDERFASTEHYTEYLDAAKYLQKLNYNDARQSTIRRVEEAIDAMEQERLFGKSN